MANDPSLWLPLRSGPASGRALSKPRYKICNRVAWPSTVFLVVDNSPCRRSIDHRPSTSSFYIITTTHVCHSLTVAHAPRSGPPGYKDNSSLLVLFSRACASVALFPAPSSHPPVSCTAKTRPGINDISLSYCPHLSLVSARPKTTYPIACNITVQLYLSCRPSDRMDSCWAHQDSSSVHASTLPSTPQTSAHVINVQISASLLKDTSFCIAPLINLTGTCAARKKTLHWLSSCPCEF